METRSGGPALAAALRPTAKGRWPIRLSEAIQTFVEDIKQARSNGTAQNYGGHLRRLPAFATRDAVTEMGEPLIRAFFGQLRQAKLAPNTLAAASTAMSQFCKWGMRQRYWAHNPMDNPLLRFSQPEKMPKPFDADEVARLMALVLRPIEWVARDGLYYTGMRVTPLTRIRLCDVSFARVRIGDLEAAGTITTINKGNKPQLVYIVPDFEPVLRAWMEHRSRAGAQPYDPLLQTPAQYGGGAVSANTVERWCRAWGRAARVLKAHPHRFRHTYATDLLRQGAKLEQIQKLLGHASIHTTQAYLKVADAAVLGAALLRRRPVEYVASPPTAQPVAEVATLATDM